MTWGCKQHTMAGSEVSTLFLIHDIASGNAVTAEVMHFLFMERSYFLSLDIEQRGC